MAKATAVYIYPQLPPIPPPKTLVAYNLELTPQQAQTLFDLIGETYIASDAERRKHLCDIYSALEAAGLVGITRYETIYVTERRS
jgi:hypothetical protein